MARTMSKKPAFPAWPPSRVGEDRRGINGAGRRLPRDRMIPSPHRSWYDEFTDQSIDY